MTVVDAGGVQEPTGRSSSSSVKMYLADNAENLQLRVHPNRILIHTWWCDMVVALRTITLIQPATRREDEQ